MAGSGSSRPSLYSLARDGNIAELRSRLESGEDVDSKDVDNSEMAALHGACPNGVSNDVLELVLSYHPRLDESRNLDGYTALHMSCDVTALHVDYDVPGVTRAETNRLVAVRRLVAAGASVAAKDRLGRTPLHTAALSLRGDLVEALLQAGADVDAVDDETGSTPLLWAYCNTNKGNTLQLDLVGARSAFYMGRSM